MRASGSPSNDRGVSRSCCGLAAEGCVGDWTVIANPVSGCGAGSRAASIVVQRLREHGFSAEAVLTRCAGDARMFAAEAVGRGARQVAVCGGDGTVREVADAVAGREVALGLVPCGRGNDLARALAIPRDVEGAAAVLLEGKTRKIDLGRVGGRHFVTVACVGFDAAVAQRVHESRVPFRGTAGYVLAVLRTLLSYRAPRVILSGDFGRHAGPVTLVAVGNTPYYGGGMKILPGAVCDDGMLDMCIVQAISRLRLLRLFPFVFSGAHAGLDPVRRVQTRSVRLESDPSIWIYADGEPVCLTPATVDLAVRALTVFCPGAPDAGETARGREARKHA